MLLPDFKVSWELQCNVILHYNTSFTLEHFYLLCSSMFSLVCHGYLTLFEYILKNQNFKNEKMRTISIFSWMGQILCGMEYLFIWCSQWHFLKSLTKRYILQSTKCEHKGVSESIDSDDRNFSSVKPQEIFHFFKIFFLNISWTDLILHGME